jgi:hypothetical protein
MIKKYDDETIDEIKNALQERYIDEDYESLEDFEKDYYSFKPVSVRDLISFHLHVKKEMGYDTYFEDRYSLFEETIFNRPNIKPTEIESEEDEKESENKRKVKSK